MSEGGPKTRADLLYLAQVDDRTTKFFDRFDKNVDKMRKKWATELQKTDKATKQSGKEIGMLAGLVGGLTSSFISLGLKAVQSLKGIIQSSIQVSARAQTLAVVMGRVGANFGVTGDQLAQYEEGMRDLGITTIKTREILTSMMQANLDLSHAEDLANVARNSAVIANKNTSDSLRGIMHAITTLQPEVLRTYGIIVNNQQAYKEYAAANNMVAAEISYATKQQIMMNEVLKAGKNIEGTYTAALDTAGKQMGSMARYAEELQLKLGDTFNPAYTEWVMFMKEQLGDLNKWFDENAEAVEEVSIWLGYLAKVGLQAIRGLVDLLIWLVTQGNAAAQAIRGLAEFLDVLGIETSNLGTNFKQVLAMAAAGWAAIIEYIKTTIAVIGDFQEALKNVAKVAMTPIWDRDAAWEKQMEDAKAQLASVGEGFDGVAERAREAAETALIDNSKALGLIADEGEEAVQTVDELANGMDTLAKETTDAANKLKELNKQYAEELAEEAIKRQREAIKAAIDEARKREDIERKHQNKLKDIARDARRRRADLERDLAEEAADAAQESNTEREDNALAHADNLLQIETDYRRRLEDIRRTFEADVMEAARSNDAVAVARLIRQNKRQLETERINRDRRREDEQAEYTKGIEELNRDLERRRQAIRTDAERRRAELELDIQRELEDAATGRQRDIENLEISLARKKEDLQRQRQWEEEDRARKYAKELADLGEHFASLEALDAAGLQAILDQHGQFIEDDTALWEQYYQRRTRAATRTTTPTTSPYMAEGSDPGEEMGFGATLDTGGSEEYPEEWGFAKGGWGIATTPRTIRVAEEVPELVAAIPLQQTQNHNINMQGKIDFGGNVPDGMDGAAINQAVMGLLQQFGTQLLNAQ